MEERREWQERKWVGSRMEKEQLLGFRWKEVGRKERKGGKGNYSFSIIPSTHSLSRLSFLSFFTSSYAFITLSPFWHKSFENMISRMIYFQSCALHRTDAAGIDIPASHSGTGELRFRSIPVTYWAFFSPNSVSRKFLLYSALLNLPPLKFHCADGCWDRTQDRCNSCIGSQTL